MQAFLNTAIKAARSAGDLVMRRMKRLDELRVDSKGANDYVTQVDGQAEERIIEIIRERYPDHAFLGEEGGASGDSDHTWIIDPIDGTTNFIHGFPVFAVSIALRIKGRMSTGVVYDPNRQEIFTAIRGEGAQLDGRKIRVSNRRGMEGTLIGTGFPYREKDRMTSYLAMMEDVMHNAADIRRPGSAALDLAYLASGRIDGFWEFGLKIWDIAAGSLLVREAGGLISELEGAGDYLETGNVVAGAPKVHDALLKLLQPHLGKTQR